MRRWQSLRIMNAAKLLQRSGRPIKRDREFKVLLARPRVRRVEQYSPQQASAPSDLAWLRPFGEAKYLVGQVAAPHKYPAERDDCTVEQARISFACFAEPLTQLSGTLDDSPLRSTPNP